MVEPSEIIKALAEVDKDIRVLLSEEMKDGFNQYKLSCLLSAQCGVSQAITSLDDLRIEG